MSCGEGLAMRFHEWDAVPGGGLHVELLSETGAPPVHLRGRFLAVEPPRVLEYEWGPGVVRVSVEPTDLGSALTVTYAGPGPKDMIHHGWTDTLAALDEHVMSGLDEQ